MRKRSAMLIQKTENTTAEMRAKAAVDNEKVTKSPRGKAEKRICETIKAYEEGVSDSDAHDTGLYICSRTNRIGFSVANRVVAS